jgi:flagellar biosynthesis protein FlhF
LVVILIDTAGRNHKDVELIQDINFLIENIDDPDIFLVLSMTTSYKNLVSIINSYKFLSDYKLIFTKLDESSSLGNILNIKMMTGKELSYTTFGQSVPDDIEVADIGKITNKIIGGLDEGSSN